VRTKRPRERENLSFSMDPAKLVLGASRRYFPSLLSGGVRGPKKSGQHQSKGFLEGRTQGRTRLDEVCSLCAISLCRGDWYSVLDSGGTTAFWPAAGLGLR